MSWLQSNIVFRKPPCNEQKLKSDQIILLESQSEVLWVWHFHHSVAVMRRVFTAVLRMIQCFQNCKTSGHWGSNKKCLTSLLLFLLLLCFSLSLRMASTCFSSSDPTAVNALKVYDNTNDYEDLWNRNNNLPQCSSSLPPPDSLCLVCLQIMVYVVCSNLTNGVEIVMEGVGVHINIVKSSKKLLLDILFWDILCIGVFI